MLLYCWVRVEDDGRLDQRPVLTPTTYGLSGLHLISYDPRKQSVPPEKTVTQHCLKTGPTTMA